MYEVGKNFFEIEILYIFIFTKWFVFKFHYVHILPELDSIFAIWKILHKWTLPHAYIAKKK